MEMTRPIQEYLTLQLILFPLVHNALWDVCKALRTNFLSSSYSDFTTASHHTEQRECDWAENA